MPRLIRTVFHEVYLSVSVTSELRCQNVKVAVKHTPMTSGITYSLRTLHENFEMSTVRSVAIKRFVREFFCEVGVEVNTMCSIRIAGESTN